MGDVKIANRIVREVIEKIVVMKKRGEHLSSQRRRIIHCGNIRYRWGTWNPKIYTDLH